MRRVSSTQDCASSSVLKPLILYGDRKLTVKQPGCPMHWIRNNDRDENGSFCLRGGVIHMPESIQAGMPITI